MYDLVIRGGEVVDGTGALPQIADVAVKDGLIAAISVKIEQQGREEMDAAGRIVTPGFVDIHTHYDGQVTWDDEMLPSAAHGVTTVIIGNCGIGFAPVRPGTEDWLITLMEGVEDIPGSVLHEGIQWSWESFPEYLDSIAKRRFALDVAALLPHSAVRAYVMLDRAAADEEATPDDLREMADIVRRSIAAGAVGVGTSRIAMHQGSDGSLLPGTTASEEELVVLGEAMRDAGGGVFQLVPSGIGGNTEGAVTGGNMGTLGNRRDQFRLPVEIAMLRRFAARTGQPVTFSFAENVGIGQTGFDEALAEIDLAQGIALHPQVSARSTGLLTSLGAYHAFIRRPSYQPLAGLPLGERAARMRDPAVKAAILSEQDLPPLSQEPMHFFHLALARGVGEMFVLTDEPDYEPDASSSVKAMAARAGIDPLALLYDLYLEDDGRAVLMVLGSNYLRGSLDRVEGWLTDDRFVLGLGDGGAHVRAICDASAPTFILTHWGRDRVRGGRTPIEVLIKKLSANNAELYGLTDRGTLSIGKRADINVIDFKRLSLKRPHITGDLPTGAERFLQNANGYDATIVAGVVTRRKDADTGARPGRLARRNRTVSELA